MTFTRSVRRPFRPAVKTHLSRLIEAALAGEEILLAEGGKPTVRPVSVAWPSFRIGMLAGQPGANPDLPTSAKLHDNDLLHNFRHPGSTETPGRMNRWARGADSADDRAGRDHSPHELRSR